MQTAPQAAAGKVPVTPPPGTKAVNLRDIGEVDSTGRLRKGVLFRCSQIYTADVLRELNIRTVVDLRGRAEKKKKQQRAPAGDAAAAPAGPSAAASSQGPPPLLPPGHTEDIAPGLAQGGAGASYDGGDGEMLATTLKRSGSAASENGSEGSASEGEGARRSGAAPEDLVAGFSGRAGAAGPGSAAGGFQDPETENFNLIPSREFGLAMLRMPLRVWRSSLANLVTGRDARRPFVDAFADEQLLGFTKYYKIILEHSKSNLAAVLRVFTKERNLPALVHCAHGKDRTGVVIMLLLMLCDVPHEAIVADYVQSEVELRRYRESLGLPDPSGATGAVIPLTEVIIASTEETLRAVLAWMDDKYLTVDAYLHSCGMSQAEVDAIRANLLRPEAAAAIGAAAKAATPRGA